jgi:hypothetical protein
MGAMRMGYGQNVMRIIKGQDMYTMGYAHGLAGQGWKSALLDKNELGLGAGRSSSWGKWTGKWNLRKEFDDR